MASKTYYVSSGIEKNLPKSIENSGEKINDVKTCNWVFKSGNISKLGTWLVKPNFSIIFV